MFAKFIYDYVVGFKEIIIFLIKINTYLVVKEKVILPGFKGYESFKIAQASC